MVAIAILLVIAITFAVVMKLTGISLQLISLGALITPRWPAE